VKTTSDLAIEASGLTKAFGTIPAVDGLDLIVRRGSVHGFLGPNGAGKTTVIRMLATLLRPDRGTASIFGHDVVREAPAVRRRVSLTGQFATIDSDLTGNENLVLLGRLHGLPRRLARDRAAELVEASGLAHAADRQVKTYSGGMQRRLDIASSLVVTPDLLFLDEPTTGLDPRSRRQVWELVRAIVSAGTTVLLTTQYLDEADRLADQITVIDHGRVIANGTSGQLKASAGSNILRVRLADSEQRERAEGLLVEVLDTPLYREPDPLALSTYIQAGPNGHAAERAAAALARLDEAHIAVSEFALAQPSLDEVFLALTGHSAGANAGGTEEPR
jgi:ABC-2 type transport system ATP-binding protein